MLIDRLIFGTARLVGGADARSARALLRQALAAGIRHVDTAPLYGLGTAETVVGEVLADRPDVRVTTKVGLEPPSYGTLLTYVRRAKRIIRPQPPMLAGDHPPAQTLNHNPAGAFGTTAMQRSIDRSCIRLRRDRVDLLLLHDAFRGDVGEETVALLDRQVTQGRARAAGYATGAPLDPVTDQAMPVRWTAQVAPLPEWFAGRVPHRAPMVIHSLAKTWFHAKRNDPLLAVAMARAVSVAGARGTVDPISFEMAVLYALAAAWLPETSLIFASSDGDRLAAFLTALSRMEAAVSPAMLAAAFAVDGAGA